MYHVIQSKIYTFADIRDAGWKSSKSRDFVYEAEEGHSLCLVSLPFTRTKEGISSR